LHIGETKNILSVHARNLMDLQWTTANKRISILDVAIHQRLRFSTDRIGQ
jgi:hypothetical protein